MSSDFSLMLGLAFIAAMQTPAGWIVVAGALCLGAAKFPWWAAPVLACGALPVLAMALNILNAPLATLLALSVALAVLCGSGWLAGRLAGWAWRSAR